MSHQGISHLVTPSQTEKCVHFTTTITNTHVSVFPTNVGQVVKKKLVMKALEGWYCTLINKLALDYYINIILNLEAVFQSSS